MSWTLGVMGQREAPAPDAAYWKGYWNELSGRLEPPRRRTILPDWHAWFPPLVHPVRPAWISVAAAVLLVATGIFIGQSGFFGRPETGTAMQATVFDPGLVAEFNELAADYMKRSKMVLLGLNNFDTRLDDPAALDITRQRDLSQELLFQGRLLRSHQVAAADPRLQILIDEIERVLLQVANSRGEDPRWTIQMVQEGIDKNSILLRITLVEIDQIDEPDEAEEPTVQTSSILS